MTTVLHELKVGKLLSRETVNLMFEPQLNNDGQKAWMEKLQVPAVNSVYVPAVQKN